MKNSAIQVFHKSKTVVLMESG